MWEQYRSAILDAIARAVRTMAQTAVGAIGGSAVFSDVQWNVVFSSAALAGLVSLLMSADRLTSPVAPDKPA